GEVGAGHAGVGEVGVGQVSTSEDRGLKVGPFEAGGGGGGGAELGTHPCGVVEPGGGGKVDHCAGGQNPVRGGKLVGEVVAAAFVFSSGGEPVDEQDDEGHTHQFRADVGVEVVDKPVPGPAVLVDVPDGEYRQAGKHDRQSDAGCRPGSSSTWTGPL